MILDEAGPRDARMRIDRREPQGDDEQREFQEILEQFKRGIDENLDTDDYEAHYDLGVAFKEMGLLDEAIAEFQKALREPDGRLRTSEALGIAFYDGTMFPAGYRGDAFVTLHGSWNRVPRTGYKVVRLRFANGAPTGEYDDFMTGFVADDAHVWGRPTGVAVARDGSLVVSEDQGGSVWRVTATAR